MSSGSIVAGVIAPHPPHLLYAENPPQNEARSKGGWEELRRGYRSLREDLKILNYDSVVVISPHWQTYVGTHFLGVKHFESISVDPIFPNLFRYHYTLDVDVALAEAMEQEARKLGLVTQMMRNPNFRIDYGTLVSCHMLDPQWQKPIVSISSNRSCHYYSPDVMHEQSIILGHALQRAIHQSRKRVVLVASQSLSHRHFTQEHTPPEDMRYEKPYNQHQYLWDMKIIEMLQKGQTREFMNLMPEFIEKSISESDSGALSALLSALDIPTYKPKFYAYGTVIGTGNAIMGWFPT